MQPPTYSKLLKILYQIGQALHYMHHEAQVAHGDVKLSNILISGTDFVILYLFLEIVRFWVFADAGSGSERARHSSKKLDIWHFVVYVPRNSD